MDHETDIDELFPADAAEENTVIAENTENERDSSEETQVVNETKPTSSPRRPRSKPEPGCLVCAVLLLVIVLTFGWVIISAIADVAKENHERLVRRNQAFETYRQSVERRSSGSSSYSGSKSGGGSSGYSSGSSYGSSGSTYKPKKSSGGDRKDEYNAADFGNAEDFYDEHYDDFFDYYDAEDYWNEHN